MLKMLKTGFSRFSAAATHSSLDMLQDEGLARAYVYARNDAASLLADTLQYTPSPGGLMRAEYNGVILFRDVSGYSIGNIDNPKWGVVSIGGRNYRVESEAQALAYLLARFHTFQQPDCALTRAQEA